MEPSRTRRVLVTAAALLAAVPAAVFATTPTDPAQAAVPPTPPGWSLRWSDDFTGPAGTQPSAANWIFDLGHGYPGGPANWGTGEVQNYTDSTRNIALDGAGNLRITALRDGAGTWTSSRIETRRADFRPPAGGKVAIESRIRLPDVTGQAALGYWPAFWALGSPYRGNYWNWPGIGEFDIMENVNGLNSVWGVLHCGVNPGGPCDETSGIGNSRACPGASCQSAFHTYRFEWDESVSPQQFRWYVDGQRFHSVSQNQFDAGTWNNMTSHAGYFVLLNLAVGGAFPDALAGKTPTPATVPGHSMVVDYVAVWTTGTTPPTTTRPDNPGWDAYAEIQAEQATARSGGVLENASEGGQAIGKLKNGDSLRFADVRFGSATARQFLARAASGATGGVSGLVEVRLNSPTAPPAGSFAIAGTGGWQSWRTVPANISGITGTHDVYVTFTSGQPAAYVSLNWVKFAA
ncbi:carbohydrate-binding protein [Actinosynnema sp. NPDC047251]|uniref:Carbohydrate binding family 6 n=1 Tax=Saccharothrix espanaensis (strain ATCC 51144 / DSM 44229 / JCM 9112 / NBRC 15066 / NRRL 15764) TaxID=1179773 RepID=K0JS29_SACES|nr:carbohydrate-binding protein [Saccharothrix espanaensis]CCH28606.1 Carbohydrate binding family 6 [Saccharothrix espanaensis DSM 44229]